jgi:hypothetical protein
MWRVSQRVVSRQRPQEIGVERIKAAQSTHREFCETTLHTRSGCQLEWRSLLRERSAVGMKFEDFARARAD